MATEKIQTELVITNLAHGQQPQQDLQGAIQAQQLLSAGPRKQLAQALAGSGALGDETKLLNAFARLLGARAGSMLRTTGTPVPTGRYRTNRQGEVMLDAEGNPIPEMQTPTVSARVRSDPNAHRSDMERELMRRRLRRKLLGVGDDPNEPADSAPSAEKMAKFIERVSSEDASEEALLAFKYQADLFQKAQREQAAFMRKSKGLYRKRLGLQTGLETYDPEGTVSRTFQRSLSPEEVEFHKGRMLDPTADEGEQLESESMLREEMRTRRERARSTREGSKYDQQALKDIDQIEKDVEATRKRLDTGKMRERLDAANAKLSQQGLFTRTREQVLDAMYMAGMRPAKRMTPEQADAMRPRLTPLQEREQRFLDRNKELDEKVTAYRKLAKEERVAPEGREALAEIKKDKGALKEEAKELEKDQALEEERKRTEAKTRADRRKVGTDLLVQSAGDLFNPDKSIMTTGLLGGLDKVADMTGSTLLKTVTKALTAGLERGTELQKQAEKVYIGAEPMFAREEQMRAARGLTSVRGFSPEAQKRADAAQRRLGTPDRPTAGSGTPEDIDVYSNMTTTRLKTLQQNLGSIMGLSAASQAYGQFRRQAGVIGMDTGEASLAMKTGFMAGTPTELLARAAQLGAISGNRGGGIRQGLDYRTDIGTVRYQQETLERAGLMGAPAESILGQTLSRQEAMASMGMRLDFDRDAKFQRVLQEQGIAPQQFGGITGGVDETRMGLLQQLQAPGKEVLSGLMMAEAFRRGKTVQGAADYLAKTSSAQSLEETMQGVGMGPGLMQLVATSMAPADQPSIMESLRKIREGQTAGPAAATGEGTIDDAARERGRTEFMPEYSAIGAQRGMGDKAKIAQFQQHLDVAARNIRSAADSMQSLAASAGNVVFGD
jgi:hypothetical protein